MDLHDFFIVNLRCCEAANAVESLRMAFKRSAVRSRLSPPKVLKSSRFQDFFFTFLNFRVNKQVNKSNCQPMRLLLKGWQKWQRSKRKSKVAKSFLSKSRSVWEETATANRYSSVKLGILLLNEPKSITSGVANPWCWAGILDGVRPCRSHLRVAQLPVPIVRLGSTAPALWTGHFTMPQTANTFSAMAVVPSCSASIAKKSPGAKRSQEIWPLSSVMTETASSDSVTPKGAMFGWNSFI